MKEKSEKPESFDLVSSKSPFFVTLEQINDHIGSCSNVVKNKVEFIKAVKKYKMYPDLTSTELAARLEESDEELYDLLGEGDRGFLGLAIDKVGLDTGIIPPNNREGLEDPMDDASFVQILDILLDEALASIRKGSTLNPRIKFATTSNVGYNGPDEWNCVYGSIAKAELIADTIDWMDEGMVLREDPATIIIFRIQNEKMGKDRLSVKFADVGEVLTPPSHGFSEYVVDKLAEQGLVLSKVIYVHHEGRVRMATAWPWKENTPLIVVNQLFFSAMTDFLEGFLKFTDESVNRFVHGLYAYAADVTNNDGMFPWSVNDYIHKRLLSDQVYKNWINISESTIYGGYRTKEDDPVYYRIPKGHALRPLWRGLSSGEGLTSVVNKLMHLAIQLKYRLIQSKLPITRENIESFHGRILNNGDDLFDVFEKKEDRDEYKELIEGSKFMVYDKEWPLGFSGNGIEGGWDAPATGIVKKMSTLFLQSTQVERRDCDSALGRMKYLSILGKVENFTAYPPKNAAAAVDLFLEIHCPEVTSFSQLKELAAKEERSLAEGGSERALAVVTLCRALQIPLHKAQSLNYDYTMAELVAADAEAANLLFLNFPYDVLVPRARLFRTGKTEVAAEKAANLNNNQS